MGKIRVSINDVTHSQIVSFKNLTDLAGVLSSGRVSRADKDAGDVLDVAGVAVHSLAHGVVDHRQVNLLHHRRQRTVCQIEIYNF